MPSTHVGFELEGLAKGGFVAAEVAGVSTEVAEPLQRLEDGFWGVGGLGEVEASLSELDCQLWVVVGLQCNRTLERHEH